MPRAKWMTDADYSAFESCLKDYSGGGNKYAICMSAIKKRKRKRTEKTRSWVRDKLSRAK